MIKLEREKRNLDKEIFRLDRKVKEDRAALISKREKLIDIHNKLNNVTCRNTIHITDHAVLRYLERVYGLDIGQIKEEILDSIEPSQVIELGGNGKFPINRYQKAIIQNYNIITMIDKKKVVRRVKV